MKDEKKKISNIRQKTHERVDNMLDKAENIRASGKEKIAHLKEKATTAKKNVDEHIRKNPERSVLIATGVGAVIGAIVTASIMRRKK